MIPHPLCDETPMPDAALVAAIWGPEHDAELDAWVRANARPADDLRPAKGIAIGLGICAPFWGLSYLAWRWCISWWR